MDAFPDTSCKLDDGEEQQQLLGKQLYKQFSGLNMLQIGLALTPAEIIGDDEAGEKETNKTPEFLKTSRRGSDATDSCTWVFITMGFIQSNKNTTDRAKSILVGDHLNLADNARACIFLNMYKQVKDSAFRKPIRKVTSVTAAIMVIGTLFTYPDNFRAQLALTAAKYNGAQITVAKDFVNGETYKFPLG